MDIVVDDKRPLARTIDVSCIRRQKIFLSSWALEGYQTVSAYVMTAMLSSLSLARSSRTAIGLFLHLS